MHDALLWMGVSWHCMEMTVKYSKLLQWKIETNHEKWGWMRQNGEKLGQKNGYEAHDLCRCRYSIRNRNVNVAKKPNDL